MKNISCLNNLLPINMFKQYNETANALQRVMTLVSDGFSDTATTTQRSQVVNFNIKRKDMIYIELICFLGFDWVE